MAKLTKAERDKLPESDFGDASARLFPITDQDDVDSAAHLIGKAKNPAAVKKRIIAIAKRKGLKIPDAWKEDAGMSDAAYDFTAFDPSPAAAGVVRRKAPVAFRTGDYKMPDGRTFAMSPEDLMAAVAEFSPVEIDDNHRPTHHKDGSPVPPSFFKGKLGTVPELLPADDFSFTGAVVELPAWLDSLYKDKPIPLSATFDWDTKRIKNFAITHNPRVADAAALPAGFSADQLATLPTADAIFTALTAEEARKAATPAAPAAPATPPPPVAPAVRPPATFAAKTMTPHGQAALQMHHDMAARSGAVCKGVKQSADMTADAIFTSEDERAALQAVHDSVLAGGAKCRVISPDDPSVKPMEGLRSTYFAEFAAAMEPPDVRRQRAELAKERGELEAEKRAAKEAQFAADMTAAKVRAEDAAFTLLQDRKIISADRAGLEGEYLQACLDDMRHGGEVQFSIDGQDFQKGTREAAVKARWEARYADEHPAYKEIPALGPDGRPADVHFALGDRQPPDPNGVDQKAREAALRATPQGRQILAEREAAAKAAAAKK